MSAPRILFLDIDGVLLSGKAWLLPANARAKALLEEDRPNAAEAAREAVFDPCAVALVNRLCGTAGARIVVHSNWRRFGPDLVREKLIGQGIEERHLHEDWFCLMRGFSSSKADDIANWLDDHRRAPQPERPEALDRWIPPAERTPEHEAAEEEWLAALRDHGISYVVVDDEPVLRDTPRQVRPGFADGFGTTEYRIAAALLGAVDLAQEAVPVADADLERAVRLHGGDRDAAWRWLCDAAGGRSRALLLSGLTAEEDARSLQLHGYRGDAARLHADRCARIWEEIEP